MSVNEVTAWEVIRRRTNTVGGNGCLGGRSKEERR